MNSKQDKYDESVWWSGWIGDETPKVVRITPEPTRKDAVWPWVVGSIFAFGLVLIECFR